MKEKKYERYDVLEDRCNDVKKHDNKNHHSMFSHIKRMAEANQSLEDYEDMSDEELEELSDQLNLLEP